MSPPTQVDDELDSEGMEFEARSVKDGAWFDVADFMSYRISRAGDPEVKVRFSGFGPKEDEWVDVWKHVRLRSIPCAPSECGALCQGDFILCFKEDIGQALYYDAVVIDAQRCTHDANECFCTFIVRYEHDQTEEETSITKICRRPEVDKHFQMLHASDSTKLMDPLETQNTILPKKAGFNSDYKMIAQQNMASIQSSSPPFEAYLQTMRASELTVTTTIQTAENVVDGSGSKAEESHKVAQKVGAHMLETKDASGNNFLASGSLGRELLSSRGTDPFVGYLGPVAGNALQYRPSGAVIESFNPANDRSGLSAHDESMSMSNKSNWVLAKLKPEDFNVGKICPVLSKSEGRKYGWVLAKLKAEELKGGAIYPFLSHMSSNNSASKNIANFTMRDVLH